MKRLWEDRTASTQSRVESLLQAATSRGAIKRLGQWLDRHGDEDLLRALHERVPAEEAHSGDVPGKTLLRWARAREETARTRKNPIARDEAFVCGHCAESVTPHGRTARDHCPSCLRSVHVDVVPGDRASSCGGLLDPVGIQMRNGHPILLYRCRVCGHETRCRAVLDGDPPDSWQAIVSLSARDS